jgi:hypothetical protein
VTAPTRPDYGIYDPRIVKIDLYGNARAECVACGDECDLRQGIPINEYGEPADHYEWPDCDVSRSACKPCYDAYMAGGPEGLSNHLHATKVERAKAKHRGIDYYRVLLDRQQKCEGMEATFADEWARENAERGPIIDQLAMLPCRRGDEGAAETRGIGGYQRCALEGGANARDRVVAATIVQWLGTNVGSSFLYETLRKCGYKLVKDEGVKRG